jgi:uncharacterized protein (DUF302 family)
MTEAISESLILLLDAYGSCLEGNGMEETRYGLKVSIPVSYDEAVVRATDALKAQGFGVLTSIDVKATLKAKLDQDLRKYLILGGCNPPLADRALHAKLEVGRLLPCNVIVDETSPSSAVVAAMAPVAGHWVSSGTTPRWRRSRGKPTHAYDRRSRRSNRCPHNTVPRVCRQSKDCAIVSHVHASWLTESPEVRS